MKRKEQVNSSYMEKLFLVKCEDLAHFLIKNALAFALGYCGGAKGVVEVPVDCLKARLSYNAIAFFCAKLIYKSTCLYA